MTSRKPRVRRGGEPKYADEEQEEDATTGRTGPPEVSIPSNSEKAIRRGETESPLNCRRKKVDTQRRAYMEQRCIGRRYCIAK